MKLILESTSKMVEINGVPARVWEGKSGNGIPCHAFITRVAVAPSYRIDAGGPSIECLLCGFRSNNLCDVARKYCGHCHVFHEQVYQQFDVELRETRAPRSEDVKLWPLRMVL